jgi:hypothetical protein
MNLAAQLLDESQVLGHGPVHLAYLQLHNRDFPLKILLVDCSGGLNRSDT